MLNSPIASRLILLCGIVLAASTAYAGRPHVPCGSPFVFSGATVNVVVLPYKESGLTDAPDADSGTHLALLIKMDVLSHILGYDNVGAVQMEAGSGDRAECEMDVIANKLLGKIPGAAAQVQPGNGLVLVWGLLYQEGDDLYVQSYASFLRRDRTEDIVFPGGTDNFSARPSAQLVSFAPRRLSKRDLDRIEESFRRTNIIRREPRDDAPGEELHGVAKCNGCPADNLGFWVEERQGEWIKVRKMDPNASNREGWIHATAGLQGADLDQLLPELHFVEGAVGYLRSRVDAESKVHPAVPGAKLAEEQLAMFVANADSDAEPLAIAVARQIAGISGLLARDSLADGVAFAQPLFEHARQLAPYSANAITLSTLAEISRAGLEASQARREVLLTDPRLLAQRLAQASVLEPRNSQLIQNLRSYYHLALGAQQAGSPNNRLPKAEIQNQLHLIDTRVLKAPTVVNQPPKEKFVDPARIPADPKQTKLDLKSLKNARVNRNDTVMRPQ